MAFGADKSVLFIEVSLWRGSHCTCICMYGYCIHLCPYSFITGITGTEGSTSLLCGNDDVMNNNMNVTVNCEVEKASIAITIAMVSGVIMVS